MSRFLRLGALAGAAGGLALAVVLRLVGAAPLRDAVALEEHDGSAAHDELYTRATQELAGMLGAVLYGVCLGVVLAVVLAAVRHRLALRSDWHRAVALAAVGFLTVVLVPFLKYPANPPGVGDPDTVTRRTVLYLLMVAWSVAASWLGYRFALELRRRAVPDALRWPAVLAVHLAVVVFALVVLPANDDPVELPASLVWRFRLASLGGAAAFWAVAGLTLGWLLQRDAPPHAAGRDRVAVGADRG